MAVSPPVVGHMFGFSCHFCGHDNPDRSKFCNDCGSRLHLKRCPRCKVVNDQAADHCSQCQATFGLEPPQKAATADPAGDHSPRYGVAAATAVHSNIPESRAEHPDCLAPNIQQTFDRDEQREIPSLNDERGKLVPVITMRDTTRLVESFVVPPAAQLHRPNRWILLILAIGVVTAIAYYVDRQSAVLTGGVAADEDRTFHAMKGDETGTFPRPIRPAQTAVPLGPPSESPPADVPGIALRDEGISAMDEKTPLEERTIVPAQDTAGDLAAGLGKG